MITPSGILNNVVILEIVYKIGVLKGHILNQVIEEMINVPGIAGSE